MEEFCKAHAIKKALEKIVPGQEIFITRLNRSTLKFDSMIRSRVKALRVHGGSEYVLEIDMDAYRAHLFKLDAFRQMVAESAPCTFQAYKESDETLSRIDFDEKIPTLVMAAGGVDEAKLNVVK